MKTLVTGATGFLGANLTARLLRDDVRVRAVRRPTSRMDLLGTLAADVEWVSADILDPDSLANAMTGVSRVYHCAAHLGFDGRRNEKKLHQVNVEGTANVVNAALDAGIERLLHTSSIAALGNAYNGADCLDESAEWRPSSPYSAYAKSKYLAELEVHRGIAEGLDAVIVNPSVILGEGRSGENTTLLLEKIQSESIPFMPTGTTNVVDVRDVVEGQLRAMEAGKSGERYIFGSENLSWSEVITVLAKLLHVEVPKRRLPVSLLTPIALVSEYGSVLIGRKPVVTRETVRSSAVTRCYSNQKAVAELGCSFRPFSVTAERIVQALLRNGEQPL